MDEALRDRSRLRFGGLGPWHNSTMKPIVTGGVVPAPHHHPAPIRKKAIALPGIWIKVAPLYGITRIGFAMSGSIISKKPLYFPRGVLNE